MTEELEKIQTAEVAKFSTIAEQISQEPESVPEPSLAEKISDSLTGSSSRPQRTHESVSKEIADLKKKLESRKKIEALDPAVARAKDEVVKCLRLNDRRPLDCWEEVKAFKKEVSRLEAEHLEKTVR